MDWDGNQEFIRKTLGEVEDLANALIDEDDYERKGDLWTQISRDLCAVIARTESMTRVLQRYSEKEWEEFGKK